jgi:NAD(P)-dependent dehydrogenase (short-subunit alcohol dehydrogenase family)
MDIGIKGKLAIVTGGAGAIGQAIALELAREGANIAVIDINLDGARKVANEVKALGRKSIAIQTDVTKFAQVKLMTKKVRNELGDVDILVNVAGGTAPGVKRNFLCDKSEKDWDAMIALNLKSVFNCCRAVIERMIERRTGKIVSIASVAGVVGNAASIDYSAAKGGVIAFTKALAKEVAGYGINVNSVSPGPIATPLLMKRASDKIRKEYVVLTGMGRLGTPEDISHMVAFLVSEGANFITGHDHIVAGLRDIGGAWEVVR